MKQRAEKVLKKWGYPLPRNVGRHADNLQICSCVMCGNPRKHWKQETRQEKLAQQELEEEYTEACYGSSSPSSEASS